MGTSITTNYAGEHLGKLLSKVVTTNEMVEGNHIMVKDQIGSKFYLPRVEMSNVIQDASATPTSGGTITHTERALEPDAFDAYVEFNPESSKALWRPFQPTGPLVFHMLPPQVQYELTDELWRQVAKYMGTAIFTGNKTSGTAPYNKFNGLVYKLDNDSDVLDVASPIALTEANIIDKLELGWDQVPAEVRRDPNFKIFMSDTSLHLYFRRVTDMSLNKGSDPTTLPAARFWNKPIVPLVGFPDDAFLMTYSSFDETSNLSRGSRAAQQ